MILAETLLPGSPSETPKWTRILGRHYSTHDRGLPTEEAPGSLHSRFTACLTPVGTNANRPNCSPKSKCYQPHSYPSPFPGPPWRRAQILSRSGQFPVFTSPARVRRVYTSPSLSSTFHKLAWLRARKPGRAWPSSPCASLCTQFPKCTKGGDPMRSQTWSVPPHRGTRCLALRPRGCACRCASMSRGAGGRATSFRPGNHLPAEHPQPGAPQSALWDMPHCTGEGIPTAILYARPQKMRL